MLDSYDSAQCISGDSVTDRTPCKQNANLPLVGSDSNASTEQPIVSVCMHCGQPTAEFMGLTLDPDRHLVKRRGQAIHLRKRQFEIFELLVKKRGRPITINEMIFSMYQLENDGEACPATMASYICQLRKRLGQIGLKITNHWHGAFSLAEAGSIGMAA